MFTPGQSRSSIARTVRDVVQSLAGAINRLDKSISPSLTITNLQRHVFIPQDAIYIFHILLASFWFALMQSPSYPFKYLIPLAYAIALIIPLTSQFFLPATPIFAWILTFYSSRFIPPFYRPNISVSLLPTLESVLYGANISDILTRFTHPVLDILAWIPYGVLHFTLPFVVAILLWLFRLPPILRLWARTFGYMNLIGVLIQIALPCAAPWYELIYGLTPADYSMPGSPGGLARIDALFNSTAYTQAFTNAPVVFGAFPSLHSACATLEALFLAHFFPQSKPFVWAYAGLLYWSTMYLTHHYLIDVVGGACLAVAAFYLFLPDEMRDSRVAITRPESISPRNSLTIGGYKDGRSKYALYGLEPPPRRTHRQTTSISSFNPLRLSSEVGFLERSDSDHESEDEERMGTWRSFSYRSPPSTVYPASAPPPVTSFPLSTTVSAPGDMSSMAGERMDRNLNRQHRHTRSRSQSQTHSSQTQIYSQTGQSSTRGRGGHRHTASIVSLTRVSSDSRGGDELSSRRNSPIAGGAGFVWPAARTGMPTHLRGGDDGRR